MEQDHHSWWGATVQPQQETNPLKTHHVSELQKARLHHLKTIQLPLKCMRPIFKGLPGLVAVRYLMPRKSPSDMPTMRGAAEQKKWKRGQSGEQVASRLN